MVEVFVVGYIDGGSGGKDRGEVHRWCIWNWR